MKNIYLGCHLSIAKGFTHAAQEAVSIGANTFQFFTRNPRGGRAKALDDKDISGLTEIMEKHGFGPLLAHAPYTMNLCSDKEEVREFAGGILADDLERMKYLPFARYLFHPGSHVGQGPERGIELIAEALNKVLTEDGGPVVLLEGMAGKGSEVGGSFDEIAAIMQAVNHSSRLGVVIDTCHMHAAGYDVVNNFDGVLDEIEKKIGKGRIGGVHVNDNMMTFESHKDRHARIGEGSIGLDALAGVIANERLDGIPFNLETPNELPGYAAEIRMLRDKIESERS